MIFSSIIVTIVFFVFIIFLIISIFCWIKLFFEINKIQKLSRLSNFLSLLIAPFFLTKLLEIQKLATKNNHYAPAFFHFYETYTNLFKKEGLVLFNDFLQKPANSYNWNDFLAESEPRFKFFYHLEQFQKKVDRFSNNLRSFSAFEEAILEKINFFNLILDKTDEDLQALKIKLNFNFREIERTLSVFNGEVQNVKKTIYHHHYQDVFTQVINLQNNIIDFVEQCFDWMKLVNIFLIVLPNKNKELINSFATFNIRELKNQIVVQTLNNYDRTRIQIGLLLENFELQSSKATVLKLLTEVENKIFQLHQRAMMKKIFKNSFKFITDYFEILSKSFWNFEQTVQNFNKELFYRQFANAGYPNFFTLLHSTRQKIDNLLVESYDVEQICFFQSPLSNIKNILLSCLNLIEIKNQMELFFSTEKERNEEIFLTLLNLHSLLNKKNNFALKLSFDKKLDKLTENFLFLEQKRLNANKTDQGRDYNSLFGEFQTQVFDLKANLKNTLFLKSLAELLFVKINKMRFSDELYHNKILNCEILFLKQEYKNVIEMLLEMLRPNIYF